MNKTKQKFKLKNKEIEELKNTVATLKDVNKQQLALLRKCNKFIMASKRKVCPIKWWNLVTEIGVFFENRNTNKE